MAKAGYRGRCGSMEELRKWVVNYVGVRVPMGGVCPGHVGPMEYLWGAYRAQEDLVVWGPRGGGKTYLAAVASLLDLIHKQCDVRILGGSMEQSLRVWEHLVPMVEDLGVGRAFGRRVEGFRGGSVAVLAQSERAVRGVRVEKLRCDEVELFRPEVWEAAQLVTRSSGEVRGCVEALSTCHVRGGLMEKVIGEGGTRRVVRWCLLEVLERCPAERECKSCALWEDCGGVAKNKCNGYFKIEDAIRMKGRVSGEAWGSEVMCRGAARRGTAVFPSWSRERNVGSVGGRPTCLAMDFGFANPFVCLWIVQEGERVSVVDEYVRSGRTVGEHLVEIEGRGWGKVGRVACDPAGNGRNEQTGVSTVGVLRKAGYAVRSRGSSIADGVELVRAAVRSADGTVRLVVDPRCVRLIAAMEGYAYAEGGGEAPVKDGVHDHLVDALRYFFVNRMGEAKEGRY